MDKESPEEVLEYQGGKGLDRRTTKKGMKDRYIDTGVKTYADSAPEKEDSNG